MRIKNFLIFFIALFLSTALSSFAEENIPAVGAESAASVVPGVKPAIQMAVQPAAQVKPVVNLFAEQFFAPASQKLDHKMNEVRGFPILKTHSREQDAEFSIVTDFGGGAVKSRHLSGLKDLKAIDAYIKQNLKTANFEGVEIRQLPIPNAKSQAADFFWVGERAFSSAEEAMTAIIASKTNVELQGGNFAESVRAAPVYIPEAEKPIEVKTPAQFQKEEELILKFTD